MPTCLTSGRCSTGSLNNNEHFLYDRGIIVGKKKGSRLETYSLSVSDSLISSARLPCQVPF